MAGSNYFEQLSGPIAGDSPAGVDLQASEAAFVVLAGKGIIGQQTGIRDPDKQDWPALRKDVLTKLGKSRDLRLLPYLSAALLRTDDLQAFLSLFEVARSWLEGFGSSVHPLPEEDFNQRLNALADWQDGFAIMEPLRRIPFLRRTAAGDISLRTWLVVHGELPPGSGEDVSKLPGPAELAGALQALDQAALAALTQLLERAQESIGKIEALVSTTPDNAGSHGDLQPIGKLLKQVQGIVTSELERRAAPSPEVAAATANGAEVTSATTGAASGPMSGAGLPLGAIRSRADALRALSEVQKFFEVTEPSSPVPLLVERVKRLVDRSFLEVMEELMPDRVREAKDVAGVRERN